ncbi:acetate CoA/acetoacetate CoA-transferase alpha subunit [Evansella caseinilytica]|uniref:Acetate CoA/acetoacetate CoA-transferase alpha subunit n=1 Tax=Evansella caseinilytica TaxID=1503961 RepID=A0A1H3NLJ8_9BACI|nr:CoA transferase subunit A [Evansella caseinilytica]SDY89837.1 acetate CoA/acetoacetate CoA-transferase alpha subunit [Evansella caseinilytica]
MRETNKVISVQEACKKITSGMTIMLGGFGGVGNPPTIICEMLAAELKNLTVICNDAGFPDIGVGRLVTDKRVVRLIASHIGSNPNAGKQMTNGELEIEFSPQGTLAERIRAGGSGLGGILTDIGIGNDFVENGKQTVEVNGRRYLVETALTAEVSLVYAKKADTYGNLVYDTSARNTNPLVATAGNLTIAEAEEIVEAGELHPEEIVTPGAFVDYVVKSEGVNWTWAWERK